MRLSPPLPSPGRCFGELPRCSLEDGVWLLGTPLFWAWQSRPRGSTSPLTRTLLRCNYPVTTVCGCCLFLYLTPSRLLPFLSSIFPIPSSAFSLSYHFSILFIFSSVVLFSVSSLSKRCRRGRNSLSALFSLFSGRSGSLVM